MRFSLLLVLPEVKLEVQLNLHTNLTKTKEIHYIKQELIQLTHFLAKVLCDLVIRLLLQNQVRLTELMLEDYSLFLKRQSQLQLSSNYLSSMMNSQELSLKT